MFKKFLHSAFITTVILVSCVYSSSDKLPKENKQSPYFTYSSSAKYNTSFQSNKELDFYDFIQGITSIYVVTPERLSSSLFDDNLFQSKYRNLLTNYLHGIGMTNVAISSNEQDQLDKSVSLTQAACFKINLDYTDNYISEVSFSFISCNKDEFRFSKSTEYYIDNNWDEFLLEVFKLSYWYSFTFDPAKSYKLISLSTNWDEGSLAKYFNETATDRFEGIYEKFASNDQFKIAIVKNEPGYDIIYLSGAKNKIDWKEGDLKGTFRKTSIKDFYKVDWVMSDKTRNKEVYLSTKEEHFVNFEFADPAIGINSKYLKIYPPFSSEQTTSQSLPSASGTGFVISNDGLIITNHHVIENGDSITVQFYDDAETKSYKTKILLEDKTNDLAVLSIVDDKFKPFDNIPYKIVFAESEIGADVFTLGFPLIETMGESIKLNNGIISSKSGFLNDKQSYQLSMPINSGNSGGPLFDKSGNLIGIVSAKHTSAENVAYALKTLPLINLLKKIPAGVEIINRNTQEEKPLPQLVKSVKNYICLIKVD
jgi:S1-C subfamily serine protease